MIINTGQRTDIPAFYAKWLANRLKEGYVLVRNPYYPTLVTKFILDPKVVDVIGFCTKNPRPMFEYNDLLKPYGQFWYITITGFETDLEPNVPPIDQVIQDFKYLSKIVGPNAIGFRYTPIIVNDKYTVNRHLETFNYIATELDGYTNLAVFGFVDIYDKLKKYHPKIVDCDDLTKTYIATEFARIAQLHHLDLRLCSKEKWLNEYGININGCMQLGDYEKAINQQLIVKQKMQARKGYCSCFLSNDIGVYNSCPHMCSYCYANGDRQQIINNFKKHDDNSPLLIGQVLPTDVIKLAKQESWKSPRQKLF